MKHRPRLADHALMRRHVVDGAERFVIHHARTGALVTLDDLAARWVLLADGTRDLDGVALAASRAGLYRRASDIERLFAALDAHDLLADGVEPGAVLEDTALQWVTPARAALTERPVRVLSGFRFRCSGAGGCCRQYASIALTADDEKRARGIGMRALPGDTDGAKILLPLFGAVRTERLAMTMVDGRCLQLEDDGACALHRRGGAAAKPTACRAYPATFADDGEAIRVSSGVECDCVIDSLAGDEGEPLSTATRAAELEAGIVVRLLPERIRLGPEQSESRADVVAWMDRIEVGADAVSTCVALARQLSRSGVSTPPAVATDLEDDEVASDLRPAIERLAETMKSAAAAADAWRSARDRARLQRRAVAAAARTLLGRGVGAAVTARDVARDAERFALRAAIHGHHLVDDRSLPDAFRDFGARVLVARELRMSGSRELGHPLAVVMAAARSVG